MDQEQENRLNILLAEDNAADVFLVREAFREHKLDCDLCVIQDGEAVIAFIDQIDANADARPLDLVLLDLHLPKRDGAEILTRLRASERSGQTPVIVFTSSNSPTDQVNADKNANLQYFRKPFSLSGFTELSDIVRDILATCQPRENISAARGQNGGTTT